MADITEAGDFGESAWPIGYTCLEDYLAAREAAGGNHGT